MIPRRNLLVAVPLLGLAACTPAQRDATLVKIQEMSATLTDLVARYLLAIAPNEVAVISANNAKIQALVPGDWVGAAREVIASTVRVLVSLSGRLTPLLPAGADVALDTVLAFLSGFAGIVRAGAEGKAPPTLAEAARAAAILRVR